MIVQDHRSVGRLLIRVWTPEVDEAIRTLIEFIGDDPHRDGLRETPRRVVHSYAELFSGYLITPQQIAELLTQFDSDNFDEMIVLRNIPFTSTCEHHLMPFSGIAHVGYIPGENNGRRKVVGISKLVRLVEIFSRRLQIQERICQQVTHAMMQHLQPSGAGCVLIANHSCMSCRGVQKPTAEMVTSSLEGVFRTDEKTRSEFLRFLEIRK